MTRFPPIEGLSPDKEGAASGRHLMETGEKVNTAEMEAISYGLFGARVTNERTPLIELDASRPLSFLRDDQYANANASITDLAQGSYAMRHITGGGEAHLVSARRGRYPPGQGAFTGVGAFMQGSMVDSSSRAEWGYLDFDVDGITVRNGFLWGRDVDGFYVRVVKRGVEAYKRYQSEWNIRKGLGIDPFDGRARAYQVRFSYYGAGPVIWQIHDPITGAFVTYPILVNSWRPEPTGVSIDNPNLKVGGYVASSAGSDDFTLHVLGRHLQIDGRFNPQRRTTSATRTGIVTGALAPAMSFRSKTGFRTVPYGPGDLDAIVVAEDVRLQIRVNSTLTNPVWASIPETEEEETSLQYDVSATGIDLNTGLKVWEGILPAGLGQRGAGFSPDVITAEIPDGAVVSYVMNTLSGAAGTAHLTARMIEEF